MKFGDLPSAHRSILITLCTNQAFNTDELGRAVTPRLNPEQVAPILMKMREQGLIYSSQKPTSQMYAMWRASDYGKTVFEGRDTPAHPVPSVTTLSDRVLACLADCRARPAKSAGTVARELEANNRDVLEALDTLRNAGLVARRPGQGWYLTEATKPESGTWVVYQQHALASPKPFADEFSATAYAVARTEAHPKATHYVARLVARIKPVTQPTHVIERV